MTESATESVDDIAFQKSKRRKRRLLRSLVIAFFAALAFGLVVIFSVVFQGSQVTPPATTQMDDQNQGIESGASVDDDANRNNANAAQNTNDSSKLTEGFAMQLGSAKTVLELSHRFNRIAADNNPKNFERLQPRAIFAETVSGLQAFLLVGPFDNEKDVLEACEVLILNEAVECKPRLFEGEAIPRQ